MEKQEVYDELELKSCRTTIGDLIKELQKYDQEYILDLDDVSVFEYSGKVMIPCYRLETDEEAQERINKENKKIKERESLENTEEFRTFIRLRHKYEYTMPFNWKEVRELENKYSKDDQD